MSNRRALTRCQTCQTKHLSIFCNLKADGVEILDLAKTCSLYRKGQAIFQEGNPSFGVYCIKSGMVKLTKLGAADKETIVRFCAPGDVLGLRSLFSEDACTVSAVALQDVEACLLSKKAMLSLLSDNPKLALSVIDRLGRQVSCAEERIASLAQRSSRQRLAEVLLLLNQCYGVKQGARSALRIALSREEFSSFIGVAAENISRLISEFKSDQLITEESKIFYLLDLKKLQLIAGIVDDDGSV